MVAAKIHIDEYRKVICYLRNTDANYAINNIIINENIHARGFLGVFDGNDKVLKGAISWGSGPDLNSIVFEIKALTNKTDTNIIYCTDITQNQRNAIIKEFINQSKQKIHDRMVERNLKLRSIRRSPPGHRPVRLEGRKRGANCTDKHFKAAVSNYKFTQEFVDLAIKLTIHYR
ncbi:MAG: hypothetical protein K2X69_12890 [Silvanigrellaceae bacterium]|nr:hypothetical protein [Silvanigrellaceae bacterium]